MKRIIPTLVFASLVAVVSSPVSGQSVPALKFDVADIHPSARTSSPIIEMRSGFYRGGRYEIHSGNMVDLIGLAYGVDVEKILGGPAWLEVDRFDVIASASASSTRENLKIMQQVLLADRFGLKVHIDKKATPTFALTAGKQPKLKEADGSGQTGCNFDVQGIANRGADGPPPGLPTLLFKCGNMSMAALAEYIGTMPIGNQFFRKSPISDETGLKGTWNFEFRFTIPTGADADRENALIDVIDKQLGLKLEPRTVPLPVIFVDSVNQTPTPNLPGIEEKLPVAPTEFEVADIKPSDPDARPQNRSAFQPGGRLDMRGGTLKQMIAIAWDVWPDKIVGVQHFMDSDKYDILAKSPATATPLLQNNNQAPMDIDALRAMFRTLLIDRFKLKVHTEDRPGNAYTLVAARPKMKKAADPSARTGFKEGPGPDGKDPRRTSTMLKRLVSCQNMTMAQLAEALPRIAGGYFQTASPIVIDATGLEGAFDFTLSFSPLNLMKNGGPGRGGDAGGAGAAAGAGEASDPSGGLTIFEAIDRQLGIKLEIQKRPMPVLVIDHIESKPTDN